MDDRSPEAFEAALAALRRKERSVAELTAWLERRGYDHDRVESALAGLIEAGELDDERFARRYAADKRALRGWGSGRIREALASRGIPDRLIEAALRDDPAAAQVERAAELLVRRARALAGEADRARALGFLTRRGYDYEIAYEAIRLARSAGHLYDPGSTDGHREDANYQLFETFDP
jgi:regulatory protein